MESTQEFVDTRDYMQSKASDHGKEASREFLGIGYGGSRKTTGREFRKESRERSYKTSMEATRENSRDRHVPTSKQNSGSHHSNTLSQPRNTSSKNTARTEDIESDFSDDEYL